MPNAQCDFTFGILKNILRLYLLYIDNEFDLNIIHGDLSLLHLDS
jgi:hypothetical protein